MKYCNKCGNKVGSNDIFCSKCGSKVDKDQNSENSDRGDKDKSIKADLKIEVTNATTEKAFKKVGEAVDGGKEVVKTTAGIVKSIFIPIAFLLVIGGGVAFIYAKNKADKAREENKVFFEKIYQDKLNEERSCVIQEYKRTKKIFHNVNYDIWSSVQTFCDLTYTEVEKYQKQLGMKLEKL